MLSTKRAWSRIRTAGMCGATASKSLWLKRGFQPDLIYTSEADAPQYMEHLGIEDVLVDPKRTFMSISGAQIRENPFRYWEYIPTQAKPFFVRTVAILGGESSGEPPGKQTCQYLQHHQCVGIWPRLCSLTPRR